MMHGAPQAVVQALRAAVQSSKREIMRFNLFHLSSVHFFLHCARGFLAPDRLS